MPKLIVTEKQLSAIQLFKEGFEKTPADLNTEVSNIIKATLSLTVKDMLVTPERVEQLKQESSKLMNELVNYPDDSVYESLWPKTSTIDLIIEYLDNITGLVEKFGVDVVLN